MANNYRWVKVLLVELCDLLDNVLDGSWSFNAVSFLDLRNHWWDRWQLWPIDCGVAVILTGLAWIKARILLNHSKYGFLFPIIASQLFQRLVNFRRGWILIKLILITGQERTIIWPEILTTCMLDKFHVLFKILLNIFVNWFIVVLFVAFYQWSVTCDSWLYLILNQISQSISL